jgi:glycosyltransferase involved in cell wall biosynthesis
VSNRRLLILTYHFPPSAASGAYRLLGFARHLPRYGWRTDVIAPASLPWEPTDQHLLEQVSADTTIHSVAYPRGRMSKVFRRLAKFGVWLPGALRMLRRVVSEARPDAVLTSGPPHCVHALGMYAKRFFGIPWAADFRDPWVVGDAEEERKLLRVRLARRWERIFLHNADLVIGNAPRARAALQNAYPEFGDKIVTITNGFDPEGFPPRLPRDPAQKEIRILHAGEIYCGRDPRPFLDALTELHEGEESLAQSLRARFLGRATDVAREIRSRGLTETVTADGQVPYDVVRVAMAEADILLLLDSPGRKVGVPAKLYEYLGADAAILALTEEDGDTAEVLRQSGVLHRIAPPLHPERIRRAVKELVACVRKQNGAQIGDRRVEIFTRAATAGLLAGYLDHMTSAAQNTAGAGIAWPVAARRTRSLPTTSG